MLKRALWCGTVAGAVLLWAVLPVAAQEKVELTLDECLKAALENNLDLVSARLDPEINAQQVIQSDSAFDLQFETNLEHNESDRELSNSTEASQRTEDKADFSLSQLLRYGAQLDLSLQNSREESQGQFQLVPKEYTSSLVVNYTMPLLRGLGKEVATEQVLLARGNLEVSRRALLRQAQTTIQDVENAYWDLAATREALGVARASLKRAQDQLDLNRKKVEVGTLPPIDITQAEAEVASREEGVIVAETNLLNAQDDLRKLMAVPKADRMWALDLVAVDRPSLDPLALDVDAVMAEALDLRPEMENARVNLRLAELSERVARRNLRPGLDLTTLVIPTGNNFTPNPNSIFPDIDGRWRAAVAEVPDFNSYYWSVALNLSYPIGNRKAKADYAVAGLNTTRNEVLLANQEQTIRVEVRRAVRGVESGIKRVRATQASVEFERKKLDAEQKKFENGMSTSFEVFTFQTDLASAELALIQAAVDYAKAKAALEVAKGTILEARGLRLEAE